ncbi:MAG: 50S ribosomal protein L24 [Nanoarchaeota archaeon]|nr:50S ribosomal protein L24 [Nanoarchaeota archaeon]MBU1622642.1 50S ribosomal protein L24 [Nanoarchaeota archaeon]MBU1974272.1 50S ribosomal protein L24 [Nanoarchaeota archaeon]
MVKTSFVKSWNRSVQPRKQRKYRYNAPLHLKQKMLHVHLSPELRKKYGLRRVQVKKGDKVKVLRGQFKKREGKVEKVNLKQEKVFVTGIELIKKEGAKLTVPLNPTNLMITELNLNDKKRKLKLEGKKTEHKPTSKENQNKVDEKKVEKKEEPKK